MTAVDNIGDHGMSEDVGDAVDRLIEYAETLDRWTDRIGAWSALSIEIRDEYEHIDDAAVILSTLLAEAVLRLVESGDARRDLAAAKEER